MGSPPGLSSLHLQSEQKKYHAVRVSLERLRWITRCFAKVQSVCARIRFPSVGVAKQRFHDIHSPTNHLLQRPHGIYWRTNYKVSLTRKLANACGVARADFGSRFVFSHCLNLHHRKSRSHTSIPDYTRVQAYTSHSLFKQASRQDCLDRPYQDHLGGLDKAYERPLKMFC